MLYPPCKTWYSCLLHHSTMCVIKLTNKNHSVWGLPSLAKSLEQGFLGHGLLWAVVIRWYTLAQEGKWPEMRLVYFFNFQSWNKNPGQSRPWAWCDGNLPTANPWQPRLFRVVPITVYYEHFVYDKCEGTHCRPLGPGLRREEDHSHIHS